MLDRLFGSHLDHLQRAMTRAAERHSLLTQNLANVNTPGYKRRDMDFNIVLDEAHARSLQGPKSIMERQSGVEQGRGSIRVDGNSVDLEQEVMSIAETELRYQALTDFVSGYFGSLRTVIREGR
jgi:flagellar basal-body rod protein FlgB